MTSSPSPQLRHPRLVLAVALILGVAVMLGLLELGLRLVAPYGVVSVGWTTSGNGQLYGWGFDDGEMQVVRDADSGQLYLNRANPRGWRDLPRSFDKPDGMFRVLVLGDSNIFGYLVPADKTVTRQLEDKLNAQGIKAEVINLSYSGWGTDQEVEALRLEGMRYRPDVVVLHVTGNDFVDNFHWQLDGKFGRRRPFYYRVGDDGEAERQPNPNYKIPTNTRIKEFWFRHSELVKRVYTGWKTFLALRKSKYELSRGQVELIGYYLGQDAQAPVMVDLAALVDRQGVTEEQLAELATRHDLNDEQRESVLRMAERVNSQEGSTEGMYKARMEIAAPHWQLFAALVRAAKAEAGRGGAKLLLSTDVDEGRWTREMFWHNVEPSSEAKQRYFALNDDLRRLAAETDVGFVEPLLPAPRARNDAHPTVAGNAAIAENILTALKTQGLVPVELVPVGK